MKSNYKKLGPYISSQSTLNVGMEVSDLLGISNQKYFQKSHTNTIGIDLSTYRIVRTNQFAFNRATTRNGEKISIALRQGDDCIVSPSYRIFQVKDENELLSEYLLMWFKRPEFDRYVRFKSHGSAHEFFEYEQMCEVELPIPSITKQQEIVKEYNVIQNRIALNQQLIKKLEETAQAIYKQWFVDFEFPDENGKPYKSSGGEMVFNEELEKEIPIGWEVGCLNDVIDTIISHRGKSKSLMDLNNKGGNFIYPVITAMNVNNGRIVKNETIRYVDYDSYNEWMKTPLESGDVILTSEAPMGELFYISKKTDYIVSQRLFGLRIDKNKCRGIYLYFWFQTPCLKADLEGRASGTTVLGIKLSELKKVMVLIPSILQVERFEIKTKVIMDFLENKKRENEHLSDLKDFLLSKLATLEN